MPEENNNSQAGSQPAQQPAAEPVAQANTAVQVEGGSTGLPARPTMVSIISEFKGNAHVKVETKSIPPPDTKSD